jgi:hypothetical protein
MCGTLDRVRYSDGSNPVPSYTRAALKGTANGRVYLCDGGRCRGLNMATKDRPGRRFNWLCRTTVEYLGHIITPTGTSVIPSKAKAVESWPTPTNLKQLRQFVGFSGFYRHFVNQYGKIAKLLTDLLSANTPYIWGTSQQEAFVALRAALYSAPVLAFPDHALPVVVSTDASDFAIGAVLQQDQGKGLQPISYLSRNLNGAKRN